MCLFDSLAESECISSSTQLTENSLPTKINYCLTDKLGLLQACNGYVDDRACADYATDTSHKPSANFDQWVAIPSLVPSLPDLFQRTREKRGGAWDPMSRDDHARTRCSDCVGASARSVTSCGGSPTRSIDRASAYACA